MSIITYFLKKFSLDTELTKYLKKNPGKYLRLSKEDINKIQNSLLEMLKDFDTLCNDFNLKYAITGGNVLGKVRHNGFIPWDDDIDLVMPRTDYDKLKKVFNDSRFVDSYILKGPGCVDGADYRCMKFYKKGTVMRPVLSKKNAVNALFIDIMPIDNVPNNKLLATLKGFYCNILIAIIGCCDFKENTNEKLKIQMKTSFIGFVNYYIRMIFGIIFSIVSLNTWYNFFDKASIYNKDTGIITIVNGKLLYSGEIVKKDIYIPFHKCEYAGVMTYIINKPTDYLIHRYGDYKTIPNDADRETHNVEEIKL